MPLPPAFHSLDSVTSCLPFRLDEVEQANSAFLRWHEYRQEEAKRIVDIWTYCFVWHYFLLKFRRGPGSLPAEAECIVEEAYLRVERNQSTVKETNRYASWVSVVCKNVYLNYLRSPRKCYPLHAAQQNASSVAEPDWLAYDSMVMLRALQCAIERLPGYLVEVARLRFVRDCSYPEMHEVTGKELPILRSYVHKARMRLRKDPTLLVYRDYLDYPMVS